MYSRNLLALGVIAAVSGSLQAEELQMLGQKSDVNETAETTISGFNFQNQNVTYEKINGLAVFEGDIVLGTVEQAERWAEANKAGPDIAGVERSIIITGERYRWVDNLVVFQFDDVSDQVKGNVYAAIAHWEFKTPIRFIERTTENAENYPDYVNIVDDQNACWSYVGRIGGSQNLNVVPACGIGSTIHEFGHAVGLWHEQSREDRDQYVRINWENIREGKEHNFAQRISNGDDVGPYDYDSIMHYGRYFFSSNGLPTITPLQSAVIGQRNGLSQLDVASIYANYPNYKPVADIKENHYSVFFGASLLLDGSQSFDPNAQQLTYSWDLDDGNPVVNGETINYVFKDPGSYNISLTVTDTDGYQGTDNASVSVYGVEVIMPFFFSG